MPYAPFSYVLRLKTRDMSGKSKAGTAIVNLPLNDTVGATLHSGAAVDIDAFKATVDDVIAKFELISDQIVRSWAITLEFKDETKIVGASAYSDKAYISVSSASDIDKALSFRIPNPADLVRANPNINGGAKYWRVDYEEPALLDWLELYGTPALGGLFTVSDGEYVALPPAFLGDKIARG